MRLIDADDLWSEIMALPHNGDMISSEEVEQEIRYAHTVDAVEMVHGRWENGVCVSCKFDLRWLTDGENDLEQWVWDEGFDYCPNCGAKMK